MITLKTIIQELNLEVVSGMIRDRAVAAGYASDLLSTVMSRAGLNYIWVTLQSHMNVVAVASLVGVSGVIITEGSRPDADTIQRASSEGVVLMLTTEGTFNTVAKLAALGVGGTAEAS